MERGTKRKAALAASPAVERSSKRQKTPVPEAPSISRISKAQDEIQEIGLRYVQRIREARDNKNNLVGPDFDSLPSRSAYPDYYEEITLPISLETIEAKLQQGGYPSISALESDAKRMIQNAKDYNNSESSVYANAEKIRKLTLNFMKLNNPAYQQDPNYVSHATPAPPKGEVAGDPEKTQQKKPSGKIRLNTGRSASAAGQTPAAAQMDGAEEQNEKPQGAEASTRDAAQDAPADSGKESKFEGKIFQEAQEQIMDQMIHYHDEDGDLEIFQPFVNLPSRKLTDYYKAIKDPTSLQGILKKVRGIHGRGETGTGQSDFRTWDSFENEVRKVWENAQSYNEDGSEIYNLAVELEEYFKGQVAEAKKHVQEPPQPTLKLNMKKPGVASSGIKLRLGQKESPAPPGQARDSATPGAQAAGQQQKVPVKLNGTAQGAPARASSRPPSEAAAVATPAMNGIKPEQSMSAALDAQQQMRPPSQQPAMLPPSRAGMANGTPMPAPSFTSHSYAPPAPTGFDNRFRQDGRDSSNALLTLVQVTTHGSLQLPADQKLVNISIPASETLTQQNLTLNIPHNQTHLQIFPIVNPNLSSNRTRPFRLFVTLNGQRLNPGGVGSRSPPAISHDVKALLKHRALHTKDPNSSTVIDAEAVQQAAYAAQCFDVRLVQGMNRIEVECVAVAEGALGAGTLAGKGGLEMERVGVFVHLLRA